MPSLTGICDDGTVSSGAGRPYLRRVLWAPEISAVRAFHRYVEKASQLLILNRLAEHEIGSRFNRHTYRGRLHGEDD